MITLMTPMIVITYLELLQLFTFFEQTSPLLKAIFQILGDIKFFVLILVFLMVSFSNAFYLLGIQQYLDTANEEIPYASFVGAFGHVFYIAMGEF